MPDTSEPTRLKQYIQRVEENHGLLQASSARSSIKNELENQDVEYTIEPSQSLNDTDWEIISYTASTGETVYAAEKWSRVAIDDVQCTTWIFDHYPSEADLQSISNSRELHSRVLYGRLPLTFTCRECRQDTHILDIPENTGDAPLETKIRCGEIRYCNQC